MIKQGSIVKPTAGKAQDRYFVVLSIEGCRAAISDGRKRKLQNPKQKGIVHLQDTGCQLDLSEVTTNKQLRKALREKGFFRDLSL